MRSQFSEDGTVMMKLRANEFKRSIAAGRQQIGLWV
jgi:hypothetical protein